MKKLSVLAALLVAVLAGCSSGPDQAEHDVISDKITAIVGEAYSVLPCDVEVTLIGEPGSITYEGPVPADVVLDNISKWAQMTPSALEGADMVDLIELESDVVSVQVVGDELEITSGETAGSMKVHAKTMVDTPYEDGVVGGVLNEIIVNIDSDGQITSFISLTPENKNDFH